MPQQTESDGSAAGGAMARLAEALGESRRRGLPPVEKWDPPFCGDIDMRIAADGSWHYNGSPIRRPALIKLFSTVLKREGGRHFLVTPVEKLGIAVDDAPFQAVEMAVEGEGDSRSIAFRTSVDDLVQLGPGHGLRFEEDEQGGLKPYLHVRRDLWARLTRALAHDLLSLAEIREFDGRAMAGIAAGGAFFPAAPADALGETA